MDTISRGLCLALLMLTSVSLSSPGHAQDSASGLSAEHGLESKDCSTRVSTLTPPVEPGIPTFVPCVRNTTLSEKILQYFQDMLSTEFALTISSPDVRSQ
jgi:hypothetical protein